MSEPKVDWIDLATRVSDGRRIDWELAERSACTDEERQIVRQLRLVDDVARVHRSQQPGQGSRDPLEMSRTVASTVTGGDGAATAGPAQDGIRAWGHLEVRARIGEGAFGEVFHAWDANLDRAVALKLLRKMPVGSEQLASNLLREGRLLARIRHPNVVTVHGAETHAGRVGLWTELVRGRSLAELLDEHGPLGAREAALIGIDLCRALAAVHGAGLVHRDIKARNVMREEGGRILLMDFGAGRDLRDLERRDDGRISGTPLYMAPEVYDGAPATAQSDLFGLGVLLYHLVTGGYPVQAESLDDLHARHRRREMELLRDRRPDLPAAFVRVVERALDWDPGGRFATAGQMEQALAAALGIESVEDQVVPARVGRRRRSAGPLLAVAALVAAATAVVWLFPTPIGDLELEPAAPGSGAADATPPIAYSVQAALVRVDAQGRRDRLVSGARLELGDLLSLEFKASRDLHVYVINEDEAGHAYVLFPIPGFDLGNPLPADRRHVLPGAVAGAQESWLVDTPGGREFLLVLASPERLAEFEAEMSALPAPRRGQTALALPEPARMRLRGIGGLAPQPDLIREPKAGRLFALAAELTSESEEVRGVWARRIELENPAP